MIKINKNEFKKIWLDNFKEFNEKKDYFFTYESIKRKLEDLEEVLKNKSLNDFIKDYTLLENCTTIEEVKEKIKVNYENMALFNNLEYFQKIIKAFKENNKNALKSNIRHDQSFILKCFNDYLKIKLKTNKEIKEFIENNNFEIIEEEV